MDTALLYLRGLAIGFAIAAAIGPIGLLCIRRTLAEGPAVGLSSGLGAATADGLYASVAAFGLTALADLLVSWRRPLGVIGGLFLVLLAARGFRGAARATVPTGADTAPRGLPVAYGSTLALTIANPATILSFAAAFVGLGLAGHDAPGATALVLGVFSGSALWWLVLVGVAGAFRRRLGPNGIGRLATASSVLIALLGLLAIVASVAG